MKVCILDDIYESSSSPMKDHDIDATVETWLDGHVYEKHFLKKTDAVKKIQNLVRHNFDVFINLCDGAWDEDRPGIEVVMALERWGQAFTGANTAFYDPSREQMKMVCHYWDVRTPGYAFIYEPTNIAHHVKHLNYPLIVKHPNSYSSIGLTRDSRVTNLQQLEKEVAKMIQLYDGALVEEFIDGKEFTVLIAENPDDPFQPIAYPPVEFSFPAGESFKHFDMKWVNPKDMVCEPCVDQAVIQELQEVSKRLFIGLNGVGYGRCDLRMNDKGEIFMLEINPNCGVFYPLEDPGSADFILMQDPGGHKGFVELIMKAAIKRRDSKRRKWKLVMDQQFNFGMYAQQNFQSGEVIEPFEEKPHVLVSRKHVERNWNKKQLEWFHRYAYPITEEIWVMWSPEPDQWKPINHSCNPNAWLDGLNLVARHNIRQGEQITMDYATFCADTMTEFECLCGAPNCRRLIRPTDYLEPFLSEYGEHVSDFVRNKRLRN